MRFVDSLGRVVQIDPMSLTHVQSAWATRLQSQTTNDEYIGEYD